MQSSTDPWNADAFVFFGATGDLAYKQIFPALQALVARHGLTLPIVGVAKSGRDVEQLRARARSRRRSRFQSERATPMIGRSNFSFWISACSAGKICL
jgi:glucose-6-phosphate 1-dehydrogenase